MEVVTYRPAVNIVCACRNDATHIEVMIESVLSQDYDNLKLVVQDGGSTDGTVDILKKYPVKWRSERDNGISQALNRAIDFADGDIIGFTSTDDWLQPHSVKIAVNEFMDPNVMMVYGDCNMINSKGIIYKVWRSKSFDLDQLFWENYIPFQTVYIRKTALVEVGGFDESMKLVQDYDLWLRLAAKFESNAFKYVPQILGNYHMSFETAGWSNFVETVRCNDLAVSKFFATTGSSSKLKQGKKRALAGGSFTRCRFYLLAGETKSAIASLRDCLAKYPAVLLSKPYAMMKEVVKILIGKQMILKTKKYKMSG